MKIMHKLFVTLLLILVAVMGNAQGINFQGVARSANGTIIAGSNISLKLSILSKSVDATPEYVETKTVMTNTQGIFSVVVGDAAANVSVGNFKNIAWVDGVKFLKVEMDPAGGTNFINMGATQLQYVPYSFYSLGVAAANVNGVLPVEKGGTGIISSGKKGNILQSDGTKWISAPLITSDSLFLNFKVDSTNMRFQLSSMSKLLNKSADQVVSDTIENNNGIYATNNIAIGDSALNAIDSGDRNIAIGYKSLYKNTRGRSNTSVGGGENLNSNTIGYQNNAYGSATQNSMTTGNRNNSFGTLSLNAMTTGIANSAFGNASLMNIKTGNENSSFGRMSTLNLKSGSFNTVVGNQSLSMDTLGDNNTAIGYMSGLGLRNGSKNIFIGNRAGANSAFSSVSNRLVIDNSDTSKPLIYGEFDNNKVIINGQLEVTGKIQYNSAFNNTAFGMNSLVSIQDNVYSNTAFGTNSLRYNQTGYDNTAVGMDVLIQNVGGHYNTGIGRGALLKNVSSDNTAVGKESLGFNTTGSKNTAIGVQSLYNNVSGVNNTAVGFGAMSSNTTYSNSIALGYNAQVTSSNQIQLGDANITEVKTSGLISSGKGFLAKGITASTRDAIVAPEAGLMIFCKDCGDNGELEVFNGNVWTNMAGGNTAVVNSNLTSLSSGLISYYSFNGSLMDNSVSANTGIGVNTVTYTTDRFSQSSKSATLATSGDIIATTNQFANPQTLAYSFWFKTNQVGQFIGFNNGRLTHGGNWDRVISLNANGYITFYLFNGSERFMSGTNNLKDNTWHHCVVNFSLAGTVIYVDGTIAAQDNTFNLAQNYNGYFRIGGLQTGASSVSIASNTGSIDDVRIYNRILTANEITYLSTH